MPLLQIVVLALVQGITEFLPVSSSGHLALVPVFTNWEDQGLAMDVAVHFGTLGAVLLYFRGDFAIAARGLVRLARGRADGIEAHLALCLIVATIPAVFAGGLLVVTGLDAALRSVAVIGWAMLIFGLVLWWADRTGPTARAAPHWTMRHAAIMGLWQALALIPGTSRSGIAITGARKLGYDRESSARLAMLMSVPVILASFALTLAEALGAADVNLLRDGALAAVLAFASALAALTLMMRLLRSVSFTPYVIYRIVLGLILLGVAYG